MKSFITMFAALVITVSLHAAPGFSRLNIINIENRDIRVVIDGNKYNGIGNNLSLGNLNMGYHNIRIYEIRRGFFASDRLLYSSSLFLKPDRQINLVINRGGNVAINEQMMRGGDRYPDNRGGQNDGRYGNGNGYGRQDNGRYDRDDRRNGGYGRN